MGRERSGAFSSPMDATGNAVMNDPKSDYVRVSFNFRGTPR
jgi:hypothetical protein